MLFSLREPLHIDMSPMLTNITSAVQDLTLRASHAENRISDICAAHNDLVNAHMEHNLEIQRINAKFADLEGRLC